MVSMSLFQIRSMFSFGSATYWSYISNYLQLRLINIPDLRNFLPSVCKAFFFKFLRFCNLFVWKVFYPKKIAIWISFGFFQKSAIFPKFSCNRQKGKYNSFKITFHQLKNFNDCTHGNIHWKFWPRYIVSKLHCDGFPWFTRRSIRSFKILSYYLSLILFFILSLRKPPGRLNLFTLVRLKYRPCGPQLCSNVPPKGRISKYFFFLQGKNIDRFFLPIHQTLKPRPCRPFLSRSLAKVNYLPLNRYISR